MVEWFETELKLAFLLIGAQCLLARYNDVRARYFSPQYYYEDESPLVRDENDEVCSIAIEGEILLDLYMDFNRFVRTLYTNKVVLLNGIGTESHYAGGGVSSVLFALKIKQKLEAEPTTNCPILETEIQIIRSMCYLMWDEFPGSNPVPDYAIPTLEGPFTLVYSKCSDMEEPDAADDVDDPQRIFTLVPYIVTKCEQIGNRQCVKYRVCPFQNRTCEAPALVMSEFAALPRLYIPFYRPSAQVIGRSRNFGAHFQFRRQPTYLDYYGRHLGPYQNEDACPTLTDGLLIFGPFERCVWAYVFNDEVVMIPVEMKVCRINTNFVPGVFTLEIRKMYEVEPPNPCPVIEAEIRLRIDLPDIKCSLLWQDVTWIGEAKLTYMQPVCRGLDKPDSIADNNPHRIFTIVPQEVVNSSGQPFFQYKVCPYMNLSCGEMAITVTDFGGLSKIIVTNWNM